MFCLLGFLGCQKDAESHSFLDYEKDCEAVLQFVRGYFGELSTLPAYTLDMDEGYIIIDHTYQSDDSLAPSIAKLLKKGFTYMEVNPEFIIFWEDNGFYGWLFSDDAEAALKRITEKDRPYMQSRKITDQWYEVRANGSF